MTLTLDIRHKICCCNILLAVNRQYKNAKGEREADFINCVIWRQQAENLANWAKKGALIAITGRIQTRNYENQQGQRVYVTEVVADTFQMLESRHERGDVPTPPPAATQNTQNQNSPADAHEPFPNSEQMNINNIDRLATDLFLGVVAYVGNAKIPVSKNYFKVISEKISEMGGGEN